MSDPLGVAPAAPAAVLSSPTSPPDDNGTQLSWPSAPLMSNVTVSADRDSAVIIVPAVSGAVDYRAFIIPAGVSVGTDGTGAETLSGSTVWCAGYRQHNAPQGPRELLQQIEVTGLTGATRIVVEALDQTCPFTGVMGATHADINVQSTEVDAAAKGVFSIFTEPEIRSAYGNLIVNGHGGNPTHPGDAAAPNNPHVLARTAIQVTPLGNSSTGMSFFDDFSDATDQPQYVSTMPDEGRTQHGMYFQSSRWNFYSYGSETAQFFVNRGQLHMLLADWAQDIMSSNFAIPKQVAQLGSNDFLHVTYEVGSDSTDRRYWWMFLCGADTAGATIDASGKFLGNVVQTPFFMDNDGLNPSVEGWNCLEVFPRQGWPFALAPSNDNPQSEVRVMTNMPGNLGRTNVVDASPAQYPSSIGPASWFRTQDASGHPNGPILDDQQLLAPRTHFDLYVSRSRVVMYVNGQQRICNDLGSHPLTMAEAAVGFGQVFYHSAAERSEFNASYWLRTGQRYYIEDTPFIDWRGWDNLGYQEHTALPSSFDPSVCYEAP